MRKYRAKQAIDSVFNQREAGDMFSYIGRKYKELSSKPFNWNDFLVPFLTRLSESRDPVVNQFCNGPVTVRVCPSEEELRKLKPEELMELSTQDEVRGIKVKRFTIDKPLTITTKEGRVLPIWMSVHNPTIKADPGWVDGIKYNYSNYGWGTSDPIAVHSLVAGTTGAGKSVCNNTILFNMLYRYSPWELNVYMSDAKIVEFKRYAESHHIPHIKAIAAAIDQSYAVTMVEYLCELMKIRQDLFQRVGTQNLKDFCKTLNVRMPVIVIALEEFQAMFSMTTKDEKRRILVALDLIGRLGRAMGVHMHLASQEIGSDLPPEILKAITLRMALKLDSPTSEQVLRNNAAANINEMGILYLNSQTTVDDCIKYNTLFRVPYQSIGMFNEYGKYLEEKGLELGFGNECKFYDESKILDHEAYTKYLKEMPKDRDSLVFGMKAIYSTDPAPLERIQLGESVGENFILVGSEMKDYTRQVRLLARNWELFDKVKVGGDNSNAVQVRVFNGKSRLGRDLKFPEGSEIISPPLSSTDDLNFTIAMLAPFYNLTAFEVDSLVFSNEVTGTSKSAQTLKQLFKQSNPSLFDFINSELLDKRLEAYLTVLKTNKQIREAFGGDIIETQLKAIEKDNVKSKDISKLIDYTLPVIGTIMKYTTKGSQCTRNVVPITYVILNGVDDVVGFLSGRGCNRASERFVKSMQAGTDAGVRYITILDRLPVDVYRELLNGANFLMQSGLPQNKLEKFAKGFDSVPAIQPNLNCILDFKRTEFIKYIKYTIPEDTE